MRGGESVTADSHTPACVGWADERIELSYRLPGTGLPAAHVSCEHPIKWAHFSDDGQWHWRSERHRGCRRFDCPVSVRPGDARWGNRWLTREVAVAASRLPRTVIHVVVSPPGPQHSHIWVSALRRLRTLAYQALRSAYPGTKIQGCLVTHPERCVDYERKGGHGSLHWHAAIVPTGRFDGRAVARAHARTGWVVKVLGPRKAKQLLAYELHHAGRWVRPSILPHALANSGFATEAITWFGGLPKGVPVESQGIVCPICRVSVPGRDWREVTWSREPVGPPGALSGAVPEGSMVDLTSRGRCASTERL